MSRKRIQRKNPWQPTPAPDFLQSRGLGNGKKIREPKLPTTSDILRTRPFAPRNQDVSTPKDTRSFEEKTKGVEFAYNGFTIPVVQREEVAEENSQEQAEGETRAANIPTFAPSTPPENSILSPFSLFKTDGLGQEGTVHREEVLEEEIEQQAEVGIQEQHLEAPPDDGTIQRKCAECAAENSEEKDREIIQSKADISGISGENFNKNLFKPVPLNKQSHTGQNSLLPEGGLPNFLNKNLSGFLLTKKVSTPLPEGEVSAPATPEIKPETAVTNPQSEVAAATPETKELHQPIQAKLTVGEAGDKYEQEADAVAAQVVEKINSPQLQQPVQRQSDTGVTSVPNITVMRHSEGGTGEGASVTADVEEGIQRARGGGQGLDESVREPMEGAFGADFSGVRVHTGDEAVQMNRELGAQAFTHGSDIYFGEGKSPGNDELTAHELTHVVQQTGAIPTKRVPKQPILNLEREVDQFPERTVTPIAGEQDKMQSLSSAPVGIAKQVIWRHTQDIPENLLLVLDVDDGDFVGGCVKKIVPHVGAKLIKKGVAKGEKNMLFDIHIGFVENEKGEYCIFFYESVSRDCEMQCYPSEEEAYKAWEEIKEWLIDLIKKVLIVLAIAAIAIALAAIAVLIADAIMAALAVLILI